MQKNNILFFCILFIWLFVTAAYSQKTDWNQIHETTLAGIKKLDELKVNDAIKEFDKVIREVPKDPRGYYFKSIVYFYRYTFMSKSEDKEEFFRVSDKVVNLCKEYLNNNEDYKYYYYLGSILTYRAIAYSVNEKDMNVLMSLKEGRESYLYLRKSLELNPAYYDTYMGMGILTYVLGNLPDALKWVAGKFGFKGDRKLGKEYLKTAFEKGLYTKSEALGWLIFIYLGELNNEKAMELLRVMNSQNPENSMYLFLTGYTLLGMGKAEEAKEYFEKADHSLVPELSYLNAYYDAGMSLIYFYRNDYLNFQKYSDKFIYKFGNNDDRLYNKDNMFYLKGIVYEICGERSKANEFYEKVKKNELALIRLEFPLTEIQIKIIKSYNTALSGNPDESIATLKILEKTDMSDDERGYLCFYLAECFRIKGDYSGALSYYNKISKLKIKYEDWIYANSGFFSGIANLNLNDKKKAIAEFEKVLKYPDFSNRKKLVRLAEKMLEELK